MRKPRLVDVANLAGVSRATAARVLGGYARVGDKRTDQVFSAARELGYRTNEIARAMRAGRTQTIGVVVADISNSFFGSAIRAIIDAASDAGYQTLVVNTAEDQGREAQAVRTLIEKRVDGMIVVPSAPVGNAHLDPAETAAIPIVLLDRSADDHALPSITSDDRGAAFASVAHLLARGHDRIGIIFATSAVRTHGDRCPDHVVSTVAERVAGVRSAFVAAGRSPDERLFRYSRSDPAIAREAAAFLLRKGSGATAILTTNEETAIGALQACADLGLRVGEDVSLISFDDGPWTAVQAPPLSVVRRPVYEMGVAAVECLASMLEGRPAVSRVLPNQLVERHSVRSVPETPSEPGARRR